MALLNSTRCLHPAGRASGHLACVQMLDSSPMDARVKQKSSEDGIGFASFSLLELVATTGVGEAELTTISVCIF